MIELNPQKRMSAREILKHQVFDPIRVDETEKGAPYQIFLDVDQMDAFDYRKEECNIHKTTEAYRL